MRKIKETLRLHYEARLSNEAIAGSLRISKGNVFKTMSRFKNSGLTWPLPESMTDTQLEAVLFR